MWVIVMLGLDLRVAYGLGKGLDFRVWLIWGFEIRILKCGMLNCQFSLSQMSGGNISCIMTPMADWPWHPI